MDVGVKVEDLAKTMLVYRMGEDGMGEDGNG